MMIATMYHYSKTCNIPPILKEGLWRGEIATHVLTEKGEEAVSLTTQTDPDRLACWSNRNPLPVNTACRYRVEVDTDAPEFERAAKAWERLEVPRHFRKCLDPLGQAKWWAFWKGVIPTERFTLELRGDSGYERPDPARLAALVERIERDLARFEWVEHPEMPWVRDLVPLKPGDKDLGILAHTHPHRLLQAA